MKKQSTWRDQELSYVRSVLRDLEGPIAREALRLLTTVGAFAVDDPSELHDAVARIRDRGDEAKRIRKELDALHSQSEDGTRPSTSVVPLASFIKLSDLNADLQAESVEAAYLLGIAVGRRLGPATLELPKNGGAR